MNTLMQFLGGNPYILLFLVVGLAVWMGGFSVKGYGLGTVAAAIIAGCGVAVIGSLYGQTFHLDEFTKSLFYYLFMYGVGLRVGPSFINGLKGDGLRFAFLAVFCTGLGLIGASLGAKMLDLPMGAAGGILAGSMTMSAAIGTAEQAVTSGAVALADGVTVDQVTGMIALSYGITYIWGTVGIILICKYLPRWWGVDARKAAAEYEKTHGVPDVDDTGLTGYQPYGLRAYQLENPELSGKSIDSFLTQYPDYRIGNVKRGEELLGADRNLVLQEGDIIALGGSNRALTEHVGVIGPEVDDFDVLKISLDQAEIVVTQKEAVGKALKEYSSSPIAGQVQLTRIERAGSPIPIGTETKLERFDVLFLTGLKPAVAKAGEMLGRVAHHSTSTDLLTLSMGMILGLLIGMIEVPAFGAQVGLGNAGGLLVSGILVSSLVSRLRFFGNTPNAARNILEDMGLIVFVAIVGVNAGAALISQLTGLLALKIFIVGFIVCTVPPFLVWAIGFHIFKMNRRS